MTLLDDILDLDVPAGVQIAPASDRVAYYTHKKWNHTNGDASRASAIWIADVRKAFSARQVTNGAFDDRDPQWASNGQWIAFLSDRGGCGTTCALYRLWLCDEEEATRQRPPGPVWTNDTDMPEPAAFERIEALTASHPGGGIGPFALSPCGTMVAFVQRESPLGHQDAAEGPFAMQDRRWGGHASLMVASTNEHGMVHCWSSTAVGHVVELAWEPTTGSAHNARRIAVLTHEQAGHESVYLHGSSVWLLSSDTQQRLVHVPLHASGLLWSGQHIYFQSWNVAGDATSGLAAYAIDMANHESDTASYTCSKVYGSTVSCVWRLVRFGDDDVLVQLQEGMVDKFRLVRADRTLLGMPHAVLDYAATAEVLATVHGDVNHPSEVFSTDFTYGACVQLSHHGGSCTSFPASSSGPNPFGIPSVVKAPSPDKGDGQVLRALFLRPLPNIDAEQAEQDEQAQPPQPPFPSVVAPPYATVVVIHDGPYARSSDTFDAECHHRRDVDDGKGAGSEFGALLAPLLLRAGVAVLQPNYRGSSGGTGGGVARRGRLGAGEAADVVALTQAAIEKGLVNVERLVVAGWGHGGHVAYWLAMRNGMHGFGWRFCGALAGAAVSDWDELVLSSDRGYAAANRMERVAWRNNHVDDNDDGSGNDRSLHSGSALWQVAEAVQHERLPPRMLLLHGEADTRVPLSQAEGMYRALRSAQVQAERAVSADDADSPGTERPIYELVTYPGQAHYFAQRASIADVMGRAVRFVCEAVKQVDDWVFVDRPVEQK